MNRPWHKRYHSDALTGYLGLTLEERGAYTTILDMLYDRGEPVHENERLLAGYFGVSVRKARAVVAALIEKGKIQRTADGRLTNSRFEKESENALKTSRKHAENGSKGGRKRVENVISLNEIKDQKQATLEPASSLYQIPDTRSHIEKKDARERIEMPFDVPDIDADGDRFREFWAAYPRKENETKAQAAWLIACLTTPPETIIAGARAYSDARRGQEARYTALAAKWLEDKRWRDQIAPAEAAKEDPRMARWRRVAAEYPEVAR